jgi:hypothetical protein
MANFRMIASCVVALQVNVERRGVVSEPVGIM